MIIKLTLGQLVYFKVDRTSVSRNFLEYNKLALNFVKSRTQYIDTINLAYSLVILRFFFFTLRAVFNHRGKFFIAESRMYFKQFMLYFFKKQKNIVFLPYKWMPGFGTNFKHFRILLHMLLYKKYLEEDESRILRKVGYMIPYMQGVSRLRTSPHLVFVPSLFFNKNAYVENFALRVPVMSFVTPHDQYYGLTYPVPGTCSFYFFQLFCNLVIKLRNYSMAKEVFQFIPSKLRSNKPQKKFDLLFIENKFLKFARDLISRERFLAFSSIIPFLSSFVQKYLKLDIFGGKKTYFSFRLHSLLYRMVRFFFVQGRIIVNEFSKIAFSLYRYLKYLPFLGGVYKTMIYEKDVKDFYKKNVLLDTVDFLEFLNMYNIGLIHNILGSNVKHLSPYFTKQGRIGVKSVKTLDEFGLLLKMPILESMLDKLKIQFSYFSLQRLTFYSLALKLKKRTYKVSRLIRIFKWLARRDFFPTKTPFFNIIVQTWRIYVPPFKKRFKNQRFFKPSALKKQYKAYNKHKVFLKNKGKNWASNKHNIRSGKGRFSRSNWNNKKGFKNKPWYNMFKKDRRIYDSNRFFELQALQQKLENRVNVDFGFRAVEFDLVLAKIHYLLKKIIVVIKTPLSKLSDILKGKFDKNGDFDYEAKFYDLIFDYSYQKYMSLSFLRIIDRSFFSSSLYKKFFRIKLLLKLYSKHGLLLHHRRNAKKRKYRLVKKFTARQQGNAYYMKRYPFLRLRRRSRHLANRGYYIFRGRYYRFKRRILGKMRRGSLERFKQRAIVWGRLALKFDFASKVAFKEVLGGYIVAQSLKPYRYTKWFKPRLFRYRGKRLFRNPILKGWRRFKAFSVYARILKKFVKKHGNMATFPFDVLKLSRVLFRKVQYVREKNVAFYFKNVLFRKKYSYYAKYISSLYPSYFSDKIKKFSNRVVKVVMKKLKLKKQYRLKAYKKFQKLRRKYIKNRNMILKQKNPVDFFKGLSNFSSSNFLLKMMVNNKLKTYLFGFVMRFKKLKKRFKNLNTRRFKKMRTLYVELLKEQNNTKKMFYKIVKLRKKLLFTRKYKPFSLAFNSLNHSLFSFEKMLGSYSKRKDFKHKSRRKRKKLNYISKTKVVTRKKLCSVFLLKVKKAPRFRKMFEAKADYLRAKSNLLRYDNRIKYGIEEKQFLEKKPLVLELNVFLEKIIKLVKKFELLSFDLKYFFLLKNMKKSKLIIRKLKNIVFYNMVKLLKFFEKEAKFSLLSPFPFLYKPLCFFFKIFISSYKYKYFIDKKMFVYFKKKIFKSALKISNMESIKKKFNGIYFRSVSLHKISYKKPCFLKIIKRLKSQITLFIARIINFYCFSGLTKEKDLCRIARLSFSNPYSFLVGNVLTKVEKKRLFDLKFYFLLYKKYNKRKKFKNNDVKFFKYLFKNGSFKKLYKLKLFFDLKKLSTFSNFYFSFKKKLIFIKDRYFLNNGILSLFSYSRTTIKYKFLINKIFFKIDQNLIKNQSLAERIFMTLLKKRKRRKRKAWRRRRRRRNRSRNRNKGFFVFGNIKKSEDLSNKSKIKNKNSYKRKHDKFFFLKKKKLHPFHKTYQKKPKPSQERFLSIFRKKIMQDGFVRQFIILKKRLSSYEQQLYLNSDLVFMSLLGKYSVLPFPISLAPFKYIK